MPKKSDSTKPIVQPNVIVCPVLPPLVIPLENVDPAVLASVLLGETVYLRPSANPVPALASSGSFLGTVPERWRNEVVKRIAISATIVHIDPANVRCEVALS